MPKLSLTTVELQRLLQERVDSIPALRGQITDVRVGKIVRAGDGSGASHWAVLRISNQGSHREAVGRIIADAQQEFGLSD